MRKGRVGDIPCDDDSTPAFRFDGPSSSFRVEILVEMADSDIRAFPCEQQRDGPSDTAVRAGDDCYLVLQFA